MEFLKFAGKAAGTGLGVIVGLPTYIVGEITNSNTIREVAQGVLDVSQKTGETVGNLASGAVDVVAGAVRSDSAQQKQGLNDMGSAVEDTLTGVVKGAAGVWQNGSKVVNGLKTGDNAKLKQGCVNLAKTAAIATLAIGVLDMVDVVDIGGAEDASEVAGADEVTLVDNPNDHFVAAHERELSDGRVIWVDGDGDTTVTSQAGWTQSNPDYRVNA